MNKKYVTEVIYDEGPISRIDISLKTGLNKATVSSLVDELLDESFVMEIGLGTSTGGRKPVMLTINPTAGYCIGINVQITHLETVLTDMAGGIVYKRILPIDTTLEGLTKDSLERVLAEEIRLAAVAAPPSAHGVIGAGIALPGIVNFRTGTAFYLPNIEIYEWDVAAALTRHFPFPVFIDNDGNCGAFSELNRLNHKQMIFINVGVGIGTGIIISGRLYRGADGIAGEFGHTSISALGLLCTCGNYGCWEQYASEQALQRYCKEEGVEEPLVLSPNFAAQVAARAQEDDASRRAFQKIGQYLGIGIANLVNALNPEIVVIGGTIAQGASLFLDDIHTVLKQRALGVNKGAKLGVATEDAVVLGAARLCIANTILLSPLGDE